MEEQDTSEYGSCPNCGKTVHTSEMGSENGKVCCRHCYLKEREQLSEREQVKKEIC